MPLAEVVFDFYDKLKSITQGYGSFDYEIIDYRESDLVKLDILVNGEKVDALSVIVHKERARERAVRICDKLQRRDPKTPVQDRHPGRHRRQDHCPVHRHRLPQGRDGQVLRRRHHAKTKAPGEAEERQEADETGRLGHDPPERLHGGVKDV